MARRYDHGVIVGEKDLPKDLSQVALWLRQELKTAQDCLSHTSPSEWTTRAYLNGRISMARETMMQLEEARGD
jgi:hypothetical protein